jgi:hypothetical protein
MTLDVASGNRQGSFLLHKKAGSQKPPNMIILSQAKPGCQLSIPQSFDFLCFAPDWRYFFIESSILQ